VSAWLRSAVLTLVLAVLAAAAVAGWFRPPRVREPRSSWRVEAADPDFHAVVTRLDRALEAAQAPGDRPVPPAAELTVARRLSLAVAGCIPSLEEIRAFEAGPDPGRMDWWLAHLLDDRRSSDYLAERFARTFVGTEDGPFIIFRRHRLVSWLADQFHANRPYDQIVRELITSSGIWTSKPEVNFITVTVDQNMEPKEPDPAKLAARVSRAFLGVRIDCVQCHDDKMGGPWRQSDFHQLAAYFGSAEMSLTGVRDNPARPYEVRYLGRTNKEVVCARPPFNKGLARGDGPLRSRLADWVTHPENRPFARAAVNRVWALLFNEPLHRPVDSIPLDGSLPAGLDLLADDFVGHGFDLRRLIRIVAATRAFRADSVRGDGDPCAAGRGFAAFPLTRLRSEQLAASIVQSSKLRTIDADSHVFDRVVRYFEQGDFTAHYGNPHAEDFDEAAGTITQRLVMMNGKLVHDRTKEDLVMNAATRIGMIATDDEQAVEIAFLTVLTRRPTPDESRHFKARFLARHDEKRSAVMEDLFWALLNSTEFSWNH
jgi:Protein of unknown function (DUF1553)/Protein of unknown function (DUF1549)